MKPNSVIGPAKRFFAWILAAPILVKIMGTGILVAVIFGTLVLYQTRTTLSHMLYQLLENHTRSLTVSFAGSIERSLVTGDVFSIKKAMRDFMASNPDIAYILVEDRQNDIIIHSFEGTVPPDLAGLRSRNKHTGQGLIVLDSDKGLVFEAATSLLSGIAGSVRLATTDHEIIEHLNFLRLRMLYTLLLCMVFGLGLALALTYLLTRPIKNLLQLTGRLGDGQFDHRAKIFFSDEIGKLAKAFNQMAEVLQTAQGHLQEKENVRQAFLKRIVQAQEEERATIARDLHDHFGHSLWALLLAVQSNKKCIAASGDMQTNIEEKIQSLIDDVRQLAQGMHPAILDDYGIEIAIKRYVGEIAGTSGIQFNCKIICPAALQRLPPETEITLYRVAQEALTNIVRHSQASHASVILIRNSQETVLLIEDDGVGFDQEHIKRDGPTHLGLLGMRERISLLGAKLTVESGSCKGTTIRIIV